MRYRICDNIHGFPDSGESDIYRKFKFQFDNLLNPDEISHNDEEFEEMYVHDKDFEDNFYGFLRTYNNSMKFCVGYTGIGKTTSIRHCLSLGVSNVTRLTTRSLNNPDKRMIIFPTFLDGARRFDGDKFDLIGRVASVCTALERAHPELRNIMRTQNGRNAFCEFVINHTPRILEPKKDFENLDYSYDEEIIERLKYAQDNHPFEYYASKLKYYIMSTNSTYDRLVILLDDIEALPEKTQRNVINDYLHFFSCMNNTDVPDELDYRITMIISVRPHTLRLYHDKNSVAQFRGLEAFSLATNGVILKGPIDLSVFFQNRFDYYTSKSPKTVGNMETWDDCYKNLMQLSNAFEGKYKNMILNLCFLNVRAALAVYSKVFANRFWVQGNREREQYFTVTPSEYVFNNINVIRAIGCGNSAAFTGSEDSIIPNIFFTTESKDYSIFCLLVMQYFRKKAKTNNDGSLEITYGLHAERLEEVLAQWEKAVGKKCTEQLRCALEYLFEKKVLRKSIIDTDDIETMDKAESLNLNSMLYISPRGYELISMLSRDSVLLEMLRECAWRDYEGHNNFYSRLLSYDLMLQKKQHAIFLDLLEYIDFLREKEESVFFDPSGNIDLQSYRDAFGPTMITLELLQGVENSMRYSGLISNPEVNAKYETVKSHITESINRLQEGM